MNPLKKRSFRFGPFRLHADDQLLLRDGKPLSLPPKAFDTLLYLVQSCPHLVTRDELIRAVWPNSFVEDGSLSVSISLVRRALGEAEDGEPYIETVPRKGYRFRCEVTAVEEDRAAAEVEASGISRERSAGSAGTQVISAVELEPVSVPAFDSFPAAPLRGPGMAGSKRAITSSRLLVLAGASALVLLTAWGIYSALHRSHAMLPFGSMKISRLTSGGEVADAAISPDAKYAAFFLRENQGQSLWIRQLSAPGTVRIIAPEPGAHFSLTFSPDGSYLYYVRTGVDGLGTLYRMPALGGDAIKLLPGITGPVSFSPDGKQFAFVRVDPAHWEAALMIANQDGSGLRPIARRRRPSYFSILGVGWSRDGDSIFCLGGDAANYVSQAFRLLEVRVTDGKEKVVSPHGWAWAGPIVSAPDGESLLVSAGERAEDAHQIWRVLLSSGEVSRVTNDLSNYATLSLTNDGRTLASVQTVRPAEIWLAQAGNLERPVPLGTGDIPHLNSLAWTPDGKIAYSARLGDDISLFSLEPGAYPPRQLTAGKGDKAELAITSDGSYVVYQSEGKIWRMDRDGTNVRQLTRGAHDVHPQPFPGGQSIIYASFANWSPSIGGKPTLWSVPISGGEPKQLSDVAASLPQISPDGKLIAAAYFPGEDPRYSPHSIAVFKASGGNPVKIFSRPASASDFLYWAPGGEGLDYVVTTNGIGNIWRQPLGGGTPVQITHYDAYGLFDFAWSRAGRQLALARGNTMSDVVLITSSD